MALKTFVDNVCRQVVERHLVRHLPDIFSPRTVAGYTDEELERIAGEKQDVIEKRKYTQEQLENLKAGLNDLRKMTNNATTFVRKHHGLVAVVGCRR